MSFSSNQNSRTHVASESCPRRLAGLFDLLRLTLLPLLRSSGNKKKIIALAGVTGNSNRACGCWFSRARTSCHPLKHHPLTLVGRAGVREPERPQTIMAKTSEARMSHNCYYGRCGYDEGRWYHVYLFLLTYLLIRSLRTLIATSAACTSPCVPRSPVAIWGRDPNTNSLSLLVLPSVSAHPLLRNFRHGRSWRLH